MCLDMHGTSPSPNMQEHNIFIQYNEEEKLWFVMVSQDHTITTSSTYDLNDVIRQLINNPDLEVRFVNGLVLALFVQAYLEAEPILHETEAVANIYHAL